ncbi:MULTISPECIES: choice-of-anchor L domain-containing protein [Mesonia]|uniref:Uncharacterized protein n=1 Tax=Mesonia oceanica TaxID=2687242 RepID=A0AC61Y3U5_9FLAO|nr:MULTISPECIES: choice-of-anchor L domain-containing protein [Mesonia]MAN26856.1 hypothetical protein [Mesonia sp.]MAQ40019.1 hypothetical protein [Mesonia sp.]MBJ96526.1 hypothetical protein [Flavobacteriaceae bacterium]VVU99148.1 hypothetical protein FVB9532_00400 [Mesonia oceanica]|tara:strand:- start:4955 stop:10531 length:5577 start_codon:yes stop_codon:yes gene_type:complete
MKKITLLLFIICGYLSSYGQIGILENFDDGVPAGWSSSFLGSGTQACEGQSIRDNLYSGSTTGNLISPNIEGQSNETELSISFDYKIVDWSAATNPTAAGWGNFTVDYSTDAGATWINVGTVDDSNHVVSAECATMSYTVPATDLPEGSDFQLRFNITWAAGDYYMYYDNLSAMQVAENPPNCDAVLTTPEDGATEVSIQDSTISWSTATGLPSSYVLTVGTTSGGSDMVDGENVGNVTSYDIGDLAYSTTYYVTIVPENNIGAATDCTEYSFTVEDDPAIIVDCSDGTPEILNFCYDGNNEVLEYSFTSSDGSGITINVTEGQVENNYDEFIVLDSDGTELYNGYGASGDLSGLTFMSSGDNLTVQVSSDISVNCGSSSNYTPINIETTCSSCLMPQASFEVVSDCANGPQFMIDVDLTGLGDANDIDISDNQGNSQTVSSTGVYTFGPYTNNTDVEFTVANSQDSSCTLSSEVLTQPYCSDNYLECGIDEPINSVFCYEGYETVELTYTTDDGSNMNLVVNSGMIYTYGGTFDVIDADGTVLYSGYGDEGDLSGITLQSMGDTITVSYTAGFYDCEGYNSSEIDLTVSCSSCLNPQADFAIVEDCINGPQFFIDVDLTSLGSADDVTIEDNQGNSQLVDALGAYNFGPYSNGTLVEVVVTNNQDDSCDVTSGELTQEYCAENYLECASGDPVTTVFCYEGYETVELTYTTDDGSNMNLLVNSGMIYTFGGSFDVLDTNGDVLYSGYGEQGDGDLAGLTVQSTGDTMTVSYTAGFYDCEGFNSSAIDLTVSCSSCINPQVTYEVVSDCTSGTDQFFVDVELEGLGSASEVSINDNQGSAEVTATSPGSFTFGPFPNDTPVVITTENLDDSSCTVISPVQSQNFCPQPPIIVDESTYTVEELITDVLLGTPCATVSNVTWSTGTDFGDVNGISYFDDNDSNFPIESGVLLYSGDVNDVPGPEDGVNSSGGYNWGGDDDLTDLIQSIEGNTTSTSQNATVIEFDFVPFIEEISFDFLFASEEYGTFQCTYSDPFGFFLTGPDGTTTNIAIVPGTNDPIAVTTVRDNAYNASCESVNEQYFGEYYGDLPPAASPIDLIGRTVVMTATANVIPGQEYHIKLAVADRNDTAYNSAVFLAAGSLEIGEPELGDDITVENGNTTCGDDSIVLDTGLPDSDFVTFFWAYTDLDGNVSTVNDDQGNAIDAPSIEVTEEGTYTIQVLYGTSCLPDPVNIEVEFYPSPEVAIEDDMLQICSGGAVAIDATPSNMGELNNVTYEWFLDDAPLSASPTNPVYVASVPGTYEVIVTDDTGGCSVTETVEVELIDFDVNFDGISIGCIEEGEPTSFELTPIIDNVPAEDMGDLTYTWSTNGETTPSIVITEDGEYTVTVNYQGCFETATFNAVFVQSPIIDLGQNQSVCDGGSVLLNATPSNSGDYDTLTYEWTDGDGLEVPGVGNSSTANLPEGEYTVVVTGVYTDANSGDVITCSGTNTVFVEDVTYTVDLGADQFNCDDVASELTAVVSGEDASNATYQWYLGGVAITGETGATYTPVAEGVYTVEVSIEGCVKTDEVSILLDLTPQVDLGGDQVTCSLGDYTIDVTPSNMNSSEVTYIWMLDGTTIAEQGPTVNPSVYGYGTYEVNITSNDDPTGDCSANLTIAFIEANYSVNLTNSGGALITAINYCEEEGEIPTHEITFSAELEGVDASEVSFVWYMGEDEIIGATGPTYTVVYNEMGEFTEEYSVDVMYGDCVEISSVSSVDVSILPYESGCVISQGLSPNGDGMNDCLNLEFLDDRTGIASLKVYNRYGRLVYEMNDYVDSFCGQNSDGDNLTTGTYFYVLELEGNDPVFGNVKKGWIYINQDK